MRRCLSRLLPVVAPGPFASKSDAELVEMMKKKEISFYGVENALAPDFERAIKIRRGFVEEYIAKLPESADKEYSLRKVPYERYDWGKVVGANCENVIGYVPIPVGLAGPINMDGTEYPIPMATTEGALVASTHRGARAISACGGCRTAVLGEGMTRAPVCEVPTLAMAADVKRFAKERFSEIKKAFDSTTRFGQMTDLKVAVAGRKLYLRFRATTGDAMGMNMVTKGVDLALAVFKEHFPELHVIALSGNFCTDKKPSAINWVEGRGRTVVAEALISPLEVERTLKTSVDSLVSLNIDKNYIGSAMAGSVGGFNAQAANVVAAIFLATGQDPAQVVESSTCLTQFSKSKEGGLLASVTMPSIEVGTVGGGTHLPAQKGLLELIGCGGANQASPGANASLLARVIAAGVLSAELSLMSGLAAGHLVKAHMQHNRKSDTPAVKPPEASTPASVNNSADGNLLK